MIRHFSPGRVTLIGEHTDHPGASVAILTQGHHSLSARFEVSTLAVDQLVDRLAATPGVRRPG